MIHHIGVVSKDFGVVTKLRQFTKLDLIRIKYIDEWKCTCVMFGAGKGAMFECVIPDGGPLEKWLSERGTSLHHVAFLVDDIRSECQKLREDGIPLVSDEPVSGVGGILVNFIHPSYLGILVELVEDHGFDTQY